MVMIVYLFFKDKVVEYRDKYETSNKRLLEVTQVANQAQIRFKDTNEVLITLEERLRATEVSVGFRQITDLMRDNQLPWNFLSLVPSFVTCLLSRSNLGKVVPFVPP